MIYVIGSVNLDYVARIERLPKAGETVLGDVIEKTPGGKGANQALAAKRAGANVRMIACLGDDADGIAATLLLAEGGVDLSGVAQLDLPTGIALIEIDAEGENTIVVLPGANSSLTTEEVAIQLAELRADDVIVLQQEIPQIATKAALEIAKKVGATSILNAAPVLSDTADVALLADIIVANETEFEIISAMSSTKDNALRWYEKTGVEIALTLGAEDAIFVGAHGLIEARPPKINPVDTVGAGDTFVGYFATSLALGKTAEEIIYIAVSASATACLSKGAQAAIIGIPDIATLIK